MKLLKRLNNKGFTLVEMIAVIVIIGLISAPALYLYVDTQKQSIAGRNKIDTQSKINTSIKSVIEDLREVESTAFKDGANDIPSIETYDVSGKVTDSSSEIVGIVARTTDKTSTTKVVAYQIDSSDANNKKIIKYKSNNSTDIKRNTIVSNGLTTYTISIDASLNKEIILDNVKGFEVKKNSDGSYEISMTAQPTKVGSMELSPITVNNRFIPRYLIN